MPMEILAVLLQNVLELFTWFRVVDPDEAALKMRLGRYVKYCNSGIHFNIPFVDSYRFYDIVPVTHPLPSQSVTTQDGYSVGISIMLMYQVVDAKKASFEVVDYDADIENVAAGIITEVIWDLDDEWADIDQIKTQVIERLTPTAEDWGLELLDVKVVDLAKHKVIRALGLEHINSAVAGE